MNVADTEIIQQFTTFRDHTIELTKRVPPELLGKVPSNQSFLGIDSHAITIRHLLAHSGYSVDWWMTNRIVDGAACDDDWDFLSSEKCGNEYLVGKMEKNKDRILKFFRANDGQNMDKMIEYREDEKQVRWTGRQHLFYMMTHEIHHYGRNTIALREFGFDNFPWIAC